jgi:glycosyltransferase involved in cell wall biosynthesis
MIKIGVDGRLLQGNLTGVGKYVLNLINYICSKDENVCFSIYSNRLISCAFKFSRVKIIYDKTYFEKLKPMVWSKLFSSRLINNDLPDIFLAGDAFIPVFLKTKKIISVVHDLNAIIAPETMSRLRLITDKLFFKHDINKANVVISNSYGTAAKLKRYFNVDTDLVIHPIIDNWYKILNKTEVVNKLYNLSINNPFILTVATQEPRKNLDKTINAFISLKKSGDLNDYKLLLIGSKGWKSDNINELLKTYADDVISLGYTPDELMPYLYNGADLFVFPSSYEGFGMPVREAMLCGTQVITTDIPELREATYGKATYINPENNGQFENAISQALKHKKILSVGDLKNDDQLNKLMYCINS